MFRRLWLTAVLSFLFCKLVFMYTMNVIYLPSCESAALFKWLCALLNITWLCNEIPNYAHYVEGVEY
uniref:Uncharacterized protein n=1 Tax=Trichobilharzia regenti TaxID=157069 RepID=A0AA85IYB7_TRIRE|nr:unnamed protein product [Trichobilharzia regenti]